MLIYLWVALGSALGGVARYALTLATVALLGAGFPWGTILINVLGSFIISFFGTLSLPTGPYAAAPGLRAFVMVGICGGFTTFSSFSLQTLELARDQQWLAAAANIILSVVLCLLSVAAGHMAATRLL
jgi:CrcB protein